MLRLQPGTLAIRDARSGLTGEQGNERPRDPRRHRTSHRARPRDTGLVDEQSPRHPARREITGIYELANPPLGHPKLGGNLLDADLDDTTLP